MQQQLKRYLEDFDALAENEVKETSDLNVRYERYAEAMPLAGRFAMLPMVNKGPFSMVARLTPFRCYQVGP